MNRLAVALIAFALGMLAMDVIWLHRLAPSLLDRPQTNHEQAPQPPRRHLT